MIAAAGMNAGMHKSKVQADRVRTKNEDEYDPYVKCILQPLGRTLETKDCQVRPDRRSILLCTLCAVPTR